VPFSAVYDEVDAGGGLLTHAERGGGLEGHKSV